MTKHGSKRASAAEPRGATAPHEGMQHLAKQVAALMETVTAVKQTLDRMAAAAALPPAAEPTTDNEPAWVAELATLEPDRRPAKQWLIWLVVRDYGPIRAAVVGRHLSDLGVRERAYQKTYKALDVLALEGYLRHEQVAGKAWWTVTEKQPPANRFQGLTTWDERPPKGVSHGR